MGGSYKQKVKTRRRRKRSASRSEKEVPDKTKRPLLPPIVLAVVVLVIISSMGFLYFRERGSGDGGGDNVDGDDGTQDDTADLKHLEARFQSLSGSLIELGDYRGKVILIDLFATWCGPCKLQIEELKSVHSRYDPSDLVILSIDSDPSETRDQVSDFRSQYSAQWSFGLSTSEFYEHFPAKAIPTLYVLDRNGKVVHDNEGMEYASDLFRVIDPLV